MRDICTIRREMHISLTLSLVFICQEIVQHREVEGERKEENLAMMCHFMLFYSEKKNINSKSNHCEIDPKRTLFPAVFIVQPRINGYGDEIERLHHFKLPSW